MIRRMRRFVLSFQNQFSLCYILWGCQTQAQSNILWHWRIQQVLSTSDSIWVLSVFPYLNNLRWTVSISILNVFKVFSLKQKANVALVKTFSWWGECTQVGENDSSYLKKTYTEKHCFWGHLNETVLLALSLHDSKACESCGWGVRFVSWQLRINFTDFYTYIW